MHASAEVWDTPKDTLVRVRVQVRPVAGEGDDVRVTVPVNPLTGATVIVDVPDAPVFVATLVGLALTVKSMKVKVTAELRVREPLVPMIVIGKMPADTELQEKVAVAAAGGGDRLTLAGLIAPQDNPVGRGAKLRLTVPMNQFNGVTVMVELAVTPALTLRLVGLATIVKSRTR